MAEVYRAHHMTLDRYVAIKILHDFLADDPEFASRFEKEAQNIARLKHPHIVQVYDFEFDTDNESYYMVMELVDGVNLKDLLLDGENANRKMSLEEALRITREAAAALEYAHKAGMIHRDVKPANLIIDKQENNRVVLTDFGIAKMVTSAQFTMTGGLIGTPAYMAPEQGVGETGDERSDIYSLGVILYQLVTNQLPYDADTPLALILKHLNDPIPSARLLNPQLPPRVDEIIQKALAKDMEDRYQTASEFIKDLETAEKEIQQRKTGSADDPYGVDTESTMILPKNRQMDGPTRPFNQDEQEQLRKELTGDHSVVDDEALVDATATDTADERQQSSPLFWFTAIVLILIILGGGYIVGASSGVFPAVAFLASPTPTTSPTETPTETPSPTSATPEVIIAVTEEPTPTATATSTDTASPTASPTPTATSTHTPSLTTTSTATSTPTTTPTATTEEEACIYDYAIIEQTPEDGEAGDFFPINTEYTRTIILLNTGTCAWGVNTSLAFIAGSGESFNAGPRIFIRDRVVGVGEEVTIQFEGTLPSRGSLDPLAGEWQLRTPDQIPIGEPITISILVFDPGN